MFDDIEITWNAWRYLCHELEDVERIKRYIEKKRYPYGG